MSTFTHESMINHQGCGLFRASPWPRNRTMTKFKLIGAAALLAGVIATPALAQQAVQEPGLQAFYQSLGVGSHNFSARSYGAANALAATGNVNLSAAPARHHPRASKHRH